MDAAVEARILNNLFCEFHYDLLINRDQPAAAAMYRYRERIVLLDELAE